MVLVLAASVTCSLTLTPCGVAWLFHQMRKRILGETFWKRATKKRAKMGQAQRNPMYWKRYLEHERQRAEERQKQQKKGDKKQVVPSGQGQAVIIDEVRIKSHNTIQ